MKRGCFFQTELFSFYLQSVLLHAADQNQMCLNVTMDLKLFKNTFDYC